MRKRSKYLILIIIAFYYASAQNFIDNSSFSIVSPIKENRFHILSFENASDVKSWYIPKYNRASFLKAERQGISLVNFYSSLDVRKLTQNKINGIGEQVFEGNMGAVGLKIDYTSTGTIIQQKLVNKMSPGTYCLKLKYKFKGYTHNRLAPVEFSFSSTNLQEYYNYGLSVPKKIIQCSLLDTSSIKDYNTPWENYCATFSLSATASFITFGNLECKKGIGNWAEYLIDDIEVFSINDPSKCNCDLPNKNLIKEYFKEFQLNKIILEDSLISYEPHNNYTPFILSPKDKITLNYIVGYLQRNPERKIVFHVYTAWSPITGPKVSHSAFVRYLLYYGIKSERIKTKYISCETGKNIYCDRNSEFVELGYEIN